MYALKIVSIDALEPCQWIFKVFFVKFHKNLLLLLLSNSFVFLKISLFPSQSFISLDPSWTWYPACCQRLAARSYLLHKTPPPHSNPSKDTTQCTLTPPPMPPSDLYWFIPNWTGPTLYHNMGPQIDVTICWKFAKIFLHFCFIAYFLRLICLGNEKLHRTVKPKMATLRGRVCSEP